MTTGTPRRQYPLARILLGGLAFWLQWLYPFILVFALGDGRGIFLDQAVGWALLGAAVYILGLTPGWWVLCAVPLLWSHHRKLRAIPITAAGFSFVGLASLMTASIFMDDYDGLSPKPEYQSAAQRWFAMDPATIEFMFRLLATAGTLCLLVSVLVAITESLVRPFGPEPREK